MVTDHWHAQRLSLCFPWFILKYTPCACALLVYVLIRTLLCMSDVKLARYWITIITLAVPAISLSSPSAPPPCCHYDYTPNIAQWYFYNTDHIHSRYISEPNIYAYSKKVHVRLTNGTAYRCNHSRSLVCVHEKVPRDSPVMRFQC